MINQLFVSIIIPCRNEENFVDMCLDSIIANDYPKDKFEVLVIDGDSDDRTRKIINGYAQEYEFIKVLDNPKKITSAGLNIGIKHAKGNFIIWMSAHSHYEKDYISRSIEFLQKYNADNVGGIIKTLPRGNTFLGQTIVNSLTHRFGIGNSYFRLQNDKPRWVDTVFGGCYRRDVFDRIGLFNENLGRGQDMQFNLRLKKAGGRTLLVPDIVSYYYARSDIKSFWKHNWTNGVWAIQPFLYSDIVPVSWRHLVPLFFVTSLLGSVLLGLLERSFLWVFLGIGAAYSLTNLAASFQVSYRKRDLRYLVAMPFIFATLHFGYGLGSLWGFVILLRKPSFWLKLLKTVLTRNELQREI